MTRRHWTHRDRSHLHPLWAQVNTHDCHGSNIAEEGEQDTQTHQSPHPWHIVGGLRSQQADNISVVEFLGLCQCQQVNSYLCQYNNIVDSSKMDKFMMITFVVSSKIT